MEALLFWLILVGNIWVFYQDVTQREVYTLLLLGLMGLYGIRSYILAPTLYNFGLDVLFNVLITCLLLGVSFLIMRLRSPQLTLSAQIGTGDYLYLGCCALGFTTDWYLLILPKALIASLVLHLVLNKLIHNQQPTVPLAGYMALFANGVFIFSKVWMNP